MIDQRLSYPCSGSKTPRNPLLQQICLIEAQLRRLRILARVHISIFLCVYFLHVHRAANCLSTHQMLVITSPLLIALQYFGGDRDIFPFDRNLRNFFIALAVLCVSLPALTFGLSYLERLHQYLRFLYRSRKSPINDIER